MEGNGCIFFIPTKSCSKMAEMITPFLKSKDYSYGIVGPMGMGKSYALLDNCLRLRKSDHIVLLYVNNPAAMLIDPFYIVNEIIFCFKPVLSKIMAADITFPESIMKKLDYQNSLNFIKESEEDIYLTNEQVIKLLHSFYCVTHNEKRLDMDILFKVLRLLKEYCKSINRGFILFFDQCCLLFDTKMGYKNQEEWREIVLGPTKFFTKVVWASARDFDFSSRGLKFKRWVYYYTREELSAALQQHVLSIEENRILKYFFANMDSIMDFLQEHTMGLPWEVALFFQASGRTMQQKWKNYSRDRGKELMDDFYHVFNKENFKRDIFFATILITDFTGDTEDYLNREIFRDAFDCQYDEGTGRMKRVLLPHVIDENLMYFDEEKGTFHSASPIAKMTLWEIVMANCERVYEICSSAYSAKTYKDPELNRFIFDHLALTGIAQFVPYYLASRDNANKQIKSKPKK